MHCIGIRIDVVTNMLYVYKHVFKCFLTMNTKQFLKLAEELLVDDDFGDDL
jgi:hypothetical protein